LEADMTQSWSELWTSCASKLRVKRKDKKNKTEIRIGGFGRRKREGRASEQINRQNEKYLRNLVHQGDMK
jgi:hypothetical protein